MFPSNIPADFTFITRRGRKKRRNDEDKCLVCGGPSVGINFGAHTCAPCKAFFRRNAVKLGSYEFICYKDGDCPIAQDFRRICNCCRLAKCFRVGMDKNAIRTEDERLERNRLVEFNRKKKAEKIQPVNLLNFSTNSCLPLIANDQTLLANIHNAYENSCILLHVHKHYKMPKGDSLTIQKLMNSVSHMYSALINFFKYVPEFTNLSTDIKTNLLKTNLNQMHRLNRALVVHTTGVTNDSNSVVFKRILSADLYSELFQCIFALLPFVYDPMFIKLFLIVLIYSTGLSIRYDVNYQINDVKHILSIQNFYVELLWRYILHRCSTYQQSVKLLTAFISRLLHSQIVDEKLSEYISKVIPNQTDHLEPLMKEMWLSDKKEITS